MVFMEFGLFRRLGLLPVLSGFLPFSETLEDIGCFGDLKQFRISKTMGSLD